MCSSFSGLNIILSQESRAPLNSFSAYKTDVLFDIHNTFMKLMKMQLGSLKKVLISRPDFISEKYSVTLPHDYLLLNCRL